MGLLWDGQGEALRPILGSPGAAFLGPPAALGVPIKAAAITSRGAALVLGGEQRQPMWLEIRDTTYVLSPLSVPPGADSIWVSPSGTAAAIFYADPWRLLIVRASAASEVVITPLEVTLDRPPAALALADDGLVAIASPNSRTLTLYGDTAERRQLAVPGEMGSFAFVQGGHALLLTLEEGVYMVADPLGGAVPTQVATFRNASIVIGMDRDHALIIDPASSTLVELNLVTWTMRMVLCPCAPSSAVLMSPSLVRVTEYAEDTVWVLDRSGDHLRVLFVPPPHD